ncbi:hypothetical protein L596_028323 [Steinernema carpocapsae]|uniref:C-type lectin domain-containing protein n=1 Tax=Steinernema carpocapsae TaxID=34508 RepID=A0A4U5LY33_STECR|nr:hypothetical protein L596_028323 [Steinernema carpocapsae]
MWQCVDSEHYNYIYCGENKTVSSDYIGNWGGIVLGSPTLELGGRQAAEKEQSSLKQVEFFGAGQPHNESIYAAALQFVHRVPELQNVNVTNSSWDGVQIIAPRSGPVTLSKLNLTDNRGLGLNILVANLKAIASTSGVPKSPIMIPYNVHGWLDMRAANKTVEIESKIITYFKYDSSPVDVVKVFTAKGRKLSFRIIQMNLYPEWNGLGRIDQLSIYSDSTTSILHQFQASSSGNAPPIQAPTLGVHMRASAADGIYGFIAEIATLPTVPDSSDVENVKIRHSRLERNDRGAIQYRTVGEIGPKLEIDSSSIHHNCHFLYGNISTCSQAVELHLHNTRELHFLSNSLSHNRGGLLVSAQSSSVQVQLLALIKDSLFAFNDNSTTLAFLGNNYQKISVINNVIANNYALYHDITLVIDMAANFTHNIFANNTGLHTLDMHGYSKISREMQSLYSNYLENNVALGHGHQYKERYGFQPDPPLEDEFLRRSKRQVISQSGVSFDWWTHVGLETSRYRSTIIAETANQKYFHNYFNNPRNEFELSTGQQPPYGSSAIDARENYWGSPGGAAVAGGKIKDQEDFKDLIRVEYQPVLESNTSLIEGDCPAGWMQAGYEEFKSCYLYMGGAMTYRDAVTFCQEMNAFMPLFSIDDSRLSNLANRIDLDNRKYRTVSEGQERTPDIWISSIGTDADQCAFLNYRTKAVSNQNCNNLLPFICEKGTHPYQEPVLWRQNIIIAIVVFGVMILLICCLCLCWFMKSRDRKKHFDREKRIVRDSIRASKDMKIKQSWITAREDGLKISEAKATFGDSDSITRAHQNLVYGIPGGSFTHSDSGSKLSTLSNSFSTDTYDYTSSYYNRSTLPTKSMVSSRPDPYSQSSGSTFQPSRKTYSSIQGSVITESSAICSTCPSERDSTITEESSYDDTISAPSTGSASTVTDHPLLAAPRPSDYFRGSGRPILTPSRSYTSLQHQPVPVPTPKAPSLERPPPRPRVNTGHYANLPRPNHPPPPQPSRSLVDLYNPHYSAPMPSQHQHHMRRKSMDRTIPLETSM